MRCYLDFIDKELENYFSMHPSIIMNVMHKNDNISLNLAIKRFFYYIKYL